MTILPNQISNRGKRITKDSVSIERPTGLTSHEEIEINYDQSRRIKRIGIGQYGGVFSDSYKSYSDYTGPEEFPDGLADRVYIHDKKNGFKRKLELEREQDYERFKEEFEEADKEIGRVKREYPEYFVEPEKRE